jgi:hypothetical protein
MKSKVLIALSLISLTAAGPTLAANTAAHDHGDAHGHDGAATTLEMNAGKKWETDAALRKAMNDIRQTVAGSLHAIHENRLPAAGYGELASKVEGAVGEIVANCKLAPKADAQLHLIVADLLAGAEQMAGKGKAAQRRDGAVKVIGALEKYGTYFDHPGFQPIAH